jgi:RHS repeat-associated protein
MTARPGEFWVADIRFTGASGSKKRPVMSKKCSKPRHVAGWKAGDYGSLLKPPEWMKLAGASTDRIALSTYGYDGAGRLTSLAHDLTTIATPTPAPEITYGLGYDPANRLTSLTRDSGHSDEDATYGYDAKDQLTSVAYDNLDPESYAYDDNGNRESANGATYGAPGDNNELTSDGTYTYQYDAEGNRTYQILVPDETYTLYLYDQRDRLTKAIFVEDEAPVKIVSYTYDPFDRLVKRAVDANGDFVYDTFEYYVYDGADIALKFVDPDAAKGGGSSDPPALDTRYLNGPAVDQILAEEDVSESLASADRVLYMLTDQQGSVRDVTDNDGEVKDHILYDSYGNPDEDHPEVQHTYAYAGYFVDTATGLLRSWSRWYDPATGRWTSEDPSQGGTNWTIYVENGPTNYVDPNGRTPISTTTTADELSGIDPGSLVTPQSGATHASPAPQPLALPDLGPKAIGRVEDLGDGTRRFTFDDGTVVEEFRDNYGTLRLQVQEPGRAAHVENERGTVCRYNERLRIYEAEGSFTPEEASSFQLMLDGGLILAGGPIARALGVPLKKAGAYALGRAAEAVGPKVAGKVGSVVEGAGNLLRRVWNKAEKCAPGVPSEVEGTLSRIESGVKFSHRNDGSIFQNREGLLPTKPPGYYTEYVHPTPGVSGPGAQRIVIGQGGEIYYTPDHYGTFIPVKPGG